MSWRDRPYRDDVGGQSFGGAYAGGGLGLGLPRPTRVVTILLIVNVAVFVLEAFGLPFNHRFVEGWCGANVGELLRGQIWRALTYQYLHDIDGPFHLLFNMLGLYFFGPPLETRWGPRRFFAFYTACGAAGALLFVLLVAVGLVADGLMIGASGCVLGLLAGCAVLMPNMTIILLFFPVPIRLAAAILVVVYSLNLLTAFANSRGGVGGDAAHLGGMLFGALWCLWGEGWLAQFKEARREGAWRRKLERQQSLEREVDRILAKVHEHGIQSLTRREKQTLADATAAQRDENQRIRRM